MAQDTLKIIITAQDGVSKPAKQAQVGLEGIGKTAMELKAKLDLTREGVKIFAGVFQQAFEFGAEGAAINQTTESFNRMIGVIGASPDILERLRTASQGTVSDLKLMSSTQSLLAGASDEMARTMADAAPRILEIAKAANKANPTIGETTFLYESLMTGIKRGSPMLIDNTGLTLKLGAANETMAKALGKSAEQLSAEEQKQALLNEVMRAGDQLIRQVGGSTDSQTDAFKRLNVSIEELANKGKTALAPFLADAAAGLDLMLTQFDKTMSALKTHSQSVLESSKSYKEYRAEVDRAAQAASAHVDENGNLVRSLTAYGRVLFTQVLQPQYALTEAEYEHLRVVRQAIADAPKYADGHDLVAQAAGRLADQTKKMTKDEKAAGDQISDLALRRRQSLKQSAQDLNEAYDAMLIQQRDTKTKHEESERELLTRLAKMHRDYGVEVADGAEQLNEQLATLAERHKEKSIEVGNDIVQAKRAFNKEIENDVRALNERLTEMEENHADRLRDMNERAVDLTGNYDEQRTSRQETLAEQLAAIDEKYEERRAETARKTREKYEGMSRARQNRYVQAELALLDEQKAAERAILEAEAAKDEARAKAKFDKELAKLQAQIVRENAEYDKQQAKLKADAERKALEDKAALDEKLAMLAANLSEENTQYDKQKAKLTADADEKRIRRQAEFAEQTADVQAQIAKEDAAYSAQTEAIASEYVKQKQQLAMHLNEVDVTYSQAIEKMRGKLLEAGITQSLIDFIIAQGEAAGKSLFKQLVGPGASVGEARKPPGYQFGGVVPGPIGMPQLAMVHGGETISPAGGGGGLTFVYAPAFSLADEREAAARLMPVLDRWYQGAKRRRV